MKNYEAIIEGILFSIGEPISIDKISNILNLSKEEIKNILDNLKKKYESDNSGIKLIELEKEYQLCTKEEIYPYLKEVVKQPKKQVITDALLETLAIIAYRQPITRAEIEFIRGVKCEHVINKLIEYDLVYEVGRRKTIGNPIIFGTTQKFLRIFKINSVKDLPEVSEELLADFKLQAEEEIKIM